MEQKKEQYLCPKKLGSKLLMMFWTVPELFVLALGLVAGLWLFLVPLLVIVALAGFLTARFDLERSVVSSLVKRLRFFNSPKTYRKM